MSATLATARSLRLLELAARRPQGFSHGRAVRELGLAKVQVNRLLAGLCAVAMLRKSPDGHYLAGPRLRELLAQGGAERRLIELVAPRLAEYAAACDASVALMHWNGHHALCLASQRLVGGFPILSPGHRVRRPHRTPWGVFLLPTGLWADLDRDDPAARQWYRNERRRLLRQGYTRSLGPDRNRIAAPLRDDSGLAIGALTAVGRPGRMDPAHIRRRSGPALVAAAAQCSRLLQA